MPILVVLAACAVCAVAAPASAQAPDIPPLILRLPATARTAALGDAWVTGRDQEVVFYNPAQLIGSRRDFAVTLAQPGPGATAFSAGSSYAAGKYSLTLGWGARLLDFRVDPSATYPYSADDLLTRGSADGQSSLFTFGGAIVYKNFRIGGAGKFVSDRVATPPGSTTPVSIDQHAWLADVGVARNLWGGVAAFSVQNLGRTTAVDTTTLITPRQFLAGYSLSKSAGPLDLTMFSQVTMRRGWWSPGGGLEVGYSWIDGYTVTLRVGARRPETAREQPVSIGAGISADRLTLDYGVQFYEGGRLSHVVTVRWR